MLQDCLVSGSVVRKPTSDLLLQLLANPSLRDDSFAESCFPSASSPSSSTKPVPWASPLPSPSPSMMETQSFTARRSAASSLPAFSLPPPNSLQYPAGAYAPSSLNQATPALVSSILTPPAGLASDFSPLASSVNSGSSQSSAGGVAPYQPTGYWPTPNQPAAYSFSSAPPLSAPYAHSPSYPLMGGRTVYSPSMNFPSRNTTSPHSSDALPAPPYEMSLPPFAAGMSGGGQPPNHPGLPALAPQHPHQQGAPQSQPQHGQQQSASQPPQQSPLHAPDPYGRPPATPNYYTPSSTPQQSSFPSYAHQSPQQSPQTSAAPTDRMSPVSAPPHASMAAPQAYHSRPSYTGYALPGLAGPIMSNVHTPGNQMALVGGMSMQGYPSHHQQLYGHHSQGQPLPNDRPFKCDQCPQSFNRNHDLKRHKRIHLAVKPFPCGHCEKSFSRKDALKRHILVKGCGKGASTGTSNPNGGSQSPVDRSEVMSDSTEENSPEMSKKDLL
ncbi:transcription factor Zn, C2H [Marssonina coronariae]|uniref:Transcription factor Zn, C2H n=1 Tax=Diplocarpon coronariae TaxID=2795749 RepID=A0A218Z130_9HELO|nr:transcription factor Zn, C2H [Marssonina coronariae]